MIPISSMFPDGTMSPKVPPLPPASLGALRHLGKVFGGPGSTNLGYDGFGIGYRCGSEREDYG